MPTPSGATRWARPRAARARGFTWERHGARERSPCWTRAAEPSAPACATRCGARRRGKAAGLAAATLVNNAIQLVFTVIFTRVLGTTGYGSLAALISAFLILLVAGRRRCRSRPRARRRWAAWATGELLRATLRAWTRRLVLATVVVAAIGAVLRQPLATSSACPRSRGRAAAIPATGALWLLLSLQRGALQGLRAYGPVGWSIVARGVPAAGLRR